MSTECVFLYIITIIANPTVTSAAATTITKKTNICASIAADGLKAVVAMLCIFENATNNKFTAFNINSMHMKIMIALRRVNTPIIPMLNNAIARTM